MQAMTPVAEYIARRVELAPGSLNDGRQRDRLIAQARADGGSLARSSLADRRGFLLDASDDPPIAGVFEVDREVLRRVGVEHAVALQGLPLHHRDPFDRMLVAQASVEGTAIVSRDEALRPTA